MRGLRLGALVALILLLTACTGVVQPGGPARGPTVITTLPTMPATPSSTTPPPPPPLRVRVSAARWHLPVPLAREALSPDGSGSVLVSGGLVAGDVTTPKAYWLNLSKGSSTPVAPLAVAVHDTAGVLGPTGRPWVIGGGSSVSDSTVQEFNASTGAWAVIGHLPVVRSDLTAVTAGNKVYVVGGYNGQEVADPAVLASRNGVSWKTVARLKNPVRYPATAVLSGSIWVFGGERSGVQVDTVQQVSLTTGRTKIVSHLPQALGHASAIAVGDRILLCGGRSNGGGLSSVCRWFDPATHKLTSAGRLPWPLADSAVVRSGNTVYLLGGESPTVTDGVVRIRILGL